MKDDDLPPGTPDCVREYAAANRELVRVGGAALSQPPSPEAEGERATGRGRAAALAPFAHTWTVTLTVGVRLKSAPNAREHWAARSRRVRAERLAVAMAFSLANLPTAPAFDRVAVKLVRLGGRRWDSDNNVAGLKGCRDEVARWLGLDDGDGRVTWSCDQEPNGPHGVRINIEGG